MYTLKKMFEKFWNVVNSFSLQNLWSNRQGFYHKYGFYPQIKEWKNWSFEEFICTAILYYRTTRLLTKTVFLKMRFLKKHTKFLKSTRKSVLSHPPYRSLCTNVHIRKTLVDLTYLEPLFHWCLIFHVLLGVI